MATTVHDLLYVSYSALFGTFLLNEEFRGEMIEASEGGRAYFVLGRDQDAIGKDMLESYYKGEEPESIPEGMVYDTVIAHAVSVWKEKTDGSLEELRQLYDEFNQIIWKAHNEGKVVFGYRPDKYTNAVEMLERHGYTPNTRHGHMGYPNLAELEIGERGGGRKMDVIWPQPNQ